MKKNNIRRLAILLALLQALTLGGCKNTTPVSNSKDSDTTIECNDTELNNNYNLDLDDLKSKWENPVIYKLVQERYNPVVTHNADGTTTYSAPSICNMITGSGSSMECYYVHYVEVTKEEHDSMYKGSIGWNSFCDSLGVHESIELAPVVTYVMEPVTSSKIVNGEKEDVTTYHSVAIYSAPSSATRVEGSGADMRCYVDYVHSIIEDLEYSQDTDNELILTR